MLSFAAVSARGQVVPAAKAGSFHLTPAGSVLFFSPITRNGIVAHASPNRLYGIGAYVDVRFSRWVQIEAEGRWLRYNEYLGE